MHKFWLWLENYFACDLYLLQLTTIVRAEIFSKACETSCGRETFSTWNPWGWASYIGSISYTSYPQTSPPHTLFQFSQKLARNFLQVKVWITRFLLERPSDEGNFAGMLCRLRFFDLAGDVASAFTFTGKLRLQNESRRFEIKRFLVLASLAGRGLEAEDVAFGAALWS